MPLNDRPEEDSCARVSEAVWLFVESGVDSPRAITLTKAVSRIEIMIKQDWLAIQFTYLNDPPEAKPERKWTFS